MDLIIEQFTDLYIVRVSSGILIYFIDITNLAILPQFLIILMQKFVEIVVI